jgi:hypothetical protein
MQCTSPFYYFCENHESDKYFVDGWWLCCICNRSHRGAEIHQEARLFLPGGGLIVRDPIVRPKTPDLPEAKLISLPLR